MTSMKLRDGDITLYHRADSKNWQADIRLPDGGMSAISAHGTVLRDCVAEGLRFIFTPIGVEDDEEPKDRASETRDDEGACRAGR